MDGGRHLAAQPVREEPSALSGDPDDASEDRQGGGCAEANDQPRPDYLEFRFHPRTAGGDLSARWGLVDSPFASLLEFEVFDGVCDVQIIAGDAGLTEGPVEHFAGGSDEWASGTVLLITWLLTDQNETGGCGSFSKNSLRCAAEQVAALADACRFP